jgi:hypothetical protein
MERWQSPNEPTVSIAQVDDLKRIAPHKNDFITARGPIRRHDNAVRGTGNDRP